MGCSSKKLRDEYIFFNKTDALSLGRESQNINKPVTTRVEPVKFEY